MTFTQTTLHIARDYGNIAEKITTQVGVYMPDPKQGLQISAGSE